MTRRVELSLNLVRTGDEDDNAIERGWDNWRERVLATTGVSVSNSRDCHQASSLCVDPKIRSRKERMLQNSCANGQQTNMKFRGKENIIKSKMFSRINCTRRGRTISKTHK